MVFHQYFDWITTFYINYRYLKVTATAECELTAVEEFSGAPEQLWRIEQLTDGTYRLMPKQIPGQQGLNTRYVLYSAADSTPTLAEYDFSTDNSKWNFRNR